MLTVKKVFVYSCVCGFALFCLQGDFPLPGGGDRPGERFGPHQVCCVHPRRPRG